MMIMGNASCIYVSNTWAFLQWFVSTSIYTKTLTNFDWRLSGRYPLCDRPFGASGRWWQISHSFTVIMENSAHMYVSNMWAFLQWCVCISTYTKALTNFNWRLSCRYRLCDQLFCSTDGWFLSPWTSSSSFSLAKTLCVASNTKNN